MFLDLASTVVGGVLVLVGEGVLLTIVMIWALMGAGKKADEQAGEHRTCMYLDTLYCKDCAEQSDCKYSGNEWEA